MNSVSDYLTLQATSDVYIINQLFLVLDILEKWKHGQLYIRKRDRARLKETREIYLKNAVNAKVFGTTNRIMGRCTIVKENG